MGENTKIEWARHTFNAWIGCQEMSPACDSCYARVQNEFRHWVDGWGPHGERKRTSVANWRKPLAWDKAAAALGERHTVFSNSLSDVFDNKVPPEWRKDLFGLIRATPHLIWLLLTKRPENIIKMSEAAGGLPPNAALGTTVEDQERADHRVPHLLESKARLKPLFVFLSCEPLLGPADLCHVKTSRLDSIDALRGWRIAPELAGSLSYPKCERLDWVIAGGESGSKARPSHPGWFRSLRDQCAKAGTAFHFKQWGEWAPFYYRDDGAPRRSSNFPDGQTVHRIGKANADRLLDGVEHNGFPEVA